MTGKPLMDVAGWETFLHGVFAIAITLLVLDIRVPSVEETEGGTALIDSLAHLAPRYFAYALGFLYVGSYWIATHRTLRMLRGVDHWFLTLGLIYLMVIAAVPFATGLLAEYLGQDQGRDQVALVFFTSWQLVLAVLANVSLLYAVRGGRLLRPGLDPPAVRIWTRIAATGPLIWLVALLSALFLSATITLILMGAILIIFLLEVPHRRFRGALDRSGSTVIGRVPGLGVAGVPAARPGASICPAAATTSLGHAQRP